MKLSVLAFLLVALFAMLAQADLQDEIDQAMKKFCGGIKVTKPSKNQVFSNPKKVKVTVTRQPDAQAKVINGIDIYSIDSKGKATYLGTPWKGSYSLNKVATLTVDLTKAPKAKFPSQFEFRVWVHNKAGPDCTLMSKVFKVKSSSHSNAAEEEAIANMDANIDNGCFGIEISKPAFGEHVPASKKFAVQVDRDGASQVDTITGLELFRVNLDDRQPVKVKDSWSDKSSLHHSFNFKEKVVNPESNSAYFYKITGTTQDDENCHFFSHPFYVDA
ncbi:hypothetical protein K492DRAFT_230306 [Lichtheimia hyalospora FSU 10163]|nr:hypothetical protein K492DRAFT_230306 [Lichtheimia hyalospora FSU 10163]